MAKSAAITIIRQIHRGFLGWGINIDTYIALSQFAKSLHIASGYPADRIVVKPNCAPMDSGPGDGSGGYCLFVGRLEPDKGINLLIEAVKYLPANVRIKIAGDGVERDAVRETARSHPNVEWCGHKSGAEINELMRNAALLVFPSLAYENFPVVIAEAYSVGLPVLASRRGAMIELIDNGVTGRFFSPVDPQDLALQIQSLLNDRDGLEGMRHHARREYEQKYSPARNVDLLLNIYASTIDRVRMRWTAGTSGNHCPESTIQAAS